MKEQFVPFEIALELKRLGFEESCFAKYQKLSEGANYQFQLVTKAQNFNKLDNAISAPLYQQCFEFLCEKLDYKNPMMPINKEFRLIVLNDLIGMYDLLEMFKK